MWPWTSLCIDFAYVCILLGKLLEVELLSQRVWIVKMFISISKLHFKREPHFTLPLHYMRDPITYLFNKAYRLIIGINRNSHWKVLLYKYCLSLQRVFQVWIVVFITMAECRMNYGFAICAISTTHNLNFLQWQLLCNIYMHGIYICINSSFYFLKSGILQLIIRGRKTPERFIMCWHWFNLHKFSFVKKSLVCKCFSNEMRWNWKEKSYLLPVLFPRMILQSLSLHHTARLL